MRHFYRKALPIVTVVGALMASAAPSQSTGPALIQGAPAGEVGQRQTRDLGNRINAVGRVNSRIENRVASRLATRLDRTYEAQSGASTLIQRAASQVNRAVRPGR